MLGHWMNSILKVAVRVAGNHLRMLLLPRSVSERAQILSLRGSSIH